MIYSIPVIGWLVGLFFHISLAIPFYFCWNTLAPVYFAAFIPAIFLTLPFWHIVGLFIIVAIVKTILTPRLATVNQTTARK